MVLFLIGKIGWRKSYGVLGGFGVLIATLLSFTIKIPKRKHETSDEVEPVKDIKSSIKWMYDNSAVFYATLGSALREI